MRKFLRNALLFVPLLALASCGGGGESKPDPYKPSAEEWAANIERINTGNMQVSFKMKVAELGTQVVTMKATATKVQQEMTVSGMTMTDLIVKDGDNYFSYSKVTRQDWTKTPSTAEDFAEMKKGLLPLTLDYSNFEWGGSSLKMTNKEPIVVNMGEETTTFTNVVIAVLDKQITTIDANVTTAHGSETQSGTMQAVYTYKDASFDIEVPEVE